MAEDKKTYPVMPIASWWMLRNKFKQSIPNALSDSYVGSLNMKVQSAKNNVLPTLKQVHLIDQDAKVIEERARKWRDDSSYLSVCEEIKKEIYPQDLLDAVPDPIANREAAKRWFANDTGAGKVAVTKMVAFYSLLCEANPAKGIEKAVTKKVQETKAQSSSAQAKPQPIVRRNNKSQVSPEVRFQPSININIQVVIPVEASSTQIDEIFASMAKHFNKYNEQ